MGGSLWASGAVGRWTLFHDTPHIQVTLATGIPEERCRRVNLGYRDYHEIDPRDWAQREDEGVLLVPHAGEMLYRAKSAGTS